MRLTTLIGHRQLAHKPSEPSLGSTAHVQNIRQRILGRGHRAQASGFSEGLPLGPSQDSWQARFSPSNPQTMGLTTPEQARNIVPISTGLQPIPLSEAAQYLTGQYQQQFGLHLQTMRQHLQQHGQISGRAKTVSSIVDKLRKAVVTKDRERVTVRWAQSRISDGLGYRLVLTDGRPDTVDQCVNSISRLIRQGALQILELDNYHGQGIPAYLSDAHIRVLKKAQAETQSREGLHNPFRLVHQNAAAIKPSGYTACQLKLRFPDGSLGELQIRGPEVEKVAHVEHWVYDIRRHKHLPSLHGARSGGSHRSQLQRCIQSLNPSQQQDYLTYLADFYGQARQVELGHPAAKAPKLPDSLTAYPQLDLKRIRGSWSQ